MRLEMGDVDAALAEAHAVLALGYVPHLLKERLEKIGRWREPEPAAAAASAPAQ